MCGLWYLKAVTAVLVGLVVAVPQDDQSQELRNHSDEDFIFLEGLLVIDPDKDPVASSEGLLVIDPDKDYDSSEDYNSLEAPTEDDFTDGNPQATKLQPDELQAARLQPSHNYVISISDMANAYVTPRSSQDNHYDYSYFGSSEETSNEHDSREASGDDGRRETSDEENDLDEGSAEYEGSGISLFNWTIEGSGEDFGSGEMEASGDDNVGQEEYDEFVHTLVEEDLEEFSPIKEENLSSELDSHSNEDYDEGNSFVYSPANTNLVVHGYRGSPIGDMAKIDFLEGEMHQIKGQISQLTARMEQQSNDIGHLQRIILQLQEQINRIVYKQNHRID